MTLDRIKHLLSGLTTALAFLASIAGLTAFVSLYLSVHQFDQQQEIARQEETQRFVNLISSLELEIKGNLDVCKKMLNQKDEYLKAISSPHNSFHYMVLESVLASGELTDRRLREVMPDKVASDTVTERKFRVTLWNTYHRMVLLNQLIEHCLSIMHMQVLVKTDPEISTKTEYRLKADMGFLVTDTEYVRDQLLACLPAVRQLREYYEHQLQKE